MSQLTQTNPVAEIFVAMVQETAHLFTKDLDATSEELLASSQDGKARSILAFTAEIVGFNHMVASVLKGEAAAMPSDEERAAFTASISNREAAKAAFEGSIGALTSAIRGVEEDDWMTTIMAPWGMEATKANLAGWGAIHTAYHDGQMNLIQLLNGDNAVHWM